MVWFGWFLVWFGQIRTVYVDFTDIDLFGGVKSPIGLCEWR